MKMKLDKAYTTVANVERVKSDMQQFKTAYTDGDLLRMFCDSPNVYEGDISAYGDVLLCEVEAWSTDVQLCYRTHFTVKMFVYSYSAVYRLWFCINYNPETGEAEVNGHGIDIEKYTKAS